MNEIATSAIGAVIGGLIGGGAIVGLFWNALENRLRRTFSTTKDVDALGSRVNGLETVAIQARDAADEAQDGVRELRQEQRHHHERTTERLEAVAKQLDEASRRLEKVTMAVVRLEARQSSN